MKLYIKKKLRSRVANSEKNRIQNRIFLEGRIKIQIERDNSIYATHSGAILNKKIKNTFFTSLRKMAPGQV